MDSRPSTAGGRPRARSTFSFRSNKSSDSGNTKPIIGSLVETEKERRKSRFLGKDFTNPNKAISVPEPTVIAQEAPTMVPLRSIQHKDWKGNLITDPDSSNPARSRMERPLDTIRSFEAAIDGEYKRRTQMLRTESAGNILQGNDSDSRRNSFVGSDMNIHPRSPAGLPGASHYSTPGSSRRQSAHMDGYHQNPRGYQPAEYRRRMGPRVASAPIYVQRPQPQPEYYGYQHHHQYHDSYETAGESSGSPSEPWGTSTDPSSENSSIDRVHPMKQPENDAYGPQFGRGSPRDGPIAEEGGWYNNTRAGRSHNSPNTNTNSIYDSEINFSTSPGLELGFSNEQPAPNTSQSNGPNDGMGYGYAAPISPQQQSQQPRANRDYDPRLHPPPQIRGNGVPTPGYGSGPRPGPNSQYPPRQRTPRPFESNQNRSPLSPLGQASTPMQMRQQDQMRQPPPSSMQRTGTVQRKPEPQPKRQSWIKRKLFKS